jgi:type I pantothenate kinase
LGLRMAGAMFASAEIVEQRILADIAADGRPQRLWGYRVLQRAEWAVLGDGTHLTLSDAESAALGGVEEQVSRTEVTEVLLPLSRLLNLHADSARDLARRQDAFLGRAGRVPPFVIAVAGSVAVGKSTLARMLRAVLARWPCHPTVELVTTDGFLHPNRVLEERGLIERKGFPESYDLRGMIDFLGRVKAGEEARVPVYSHSAYDILPGKVHRIRQPDILIVEGLNLLQVPPGASVTVPDFLDFSIYLDAAEADIERWFVERVLLLQRTAFRDPETYFHQVSRLSRREAEVMARDVWQRINALNLRENILPTRARARLILTKGPDHAVSKVALRRI